jgi:hypothetical protein
MANAFVMERFLLNAAMCGRKERTSMTTHASTNGWTQLMDQAIQEGGQVFLQTMFQADPAATDAQLEAEAKQLHQHYVQAESDAKSDRAHPDLHILAAATHWSKQQAIALLRKKIAGTPIPKDFYQFFQNGLQRQIASLISEIQMLWEQEDRQQAVVEREEAEQAFGVAYPYIKGLSNALLKGESQRQTIFTEGQQAAHKWADKYEASMQKREQELNERIKLIQQQEKENREHQLALRSLATWDDRRSFVDTAVSTGKNTLGCLFLWFLLVAGILIAVFLAFPHH